MKCGLTISQFWHSTPREVYAAIDAFSWQVDRENKRDAWLVWHIAALSRAKRLPPLKRLMGGKEKDGKRLTGEKLEQRRKERREIMAKIDMDKLNKAIAKRKRKRGG